MTTPTDRSTERTSVRQVARGRADLTAAGADALAVLVFVLVGRRSHDEGPVVLGTLTTAWPFLAGAGLGWLAVLGLRASGRDWSASSIPAGATVLGGSVVGGMLLRRLSGTGGTPLSFVVVVTTFLTLVLLGWRLVVLRRRPRA
ncbi:DUF3054 domain-containing protein [Actinotalea sp.]|uniref:DUF3054 domain-containing protein n=1 Tax=Actinotalea sp. TaxID=1872145 RepID=UPI0035673ACC